MSALSSKLGDVLTVGAGLDFGLALARNIYHQSLCVAFVLGCAMSLSCLPSLSLMERISFRITSKVTCFGVEEGSGELQYLWVKDTAL